MTPWLELVTKFHALDHPDAPETLVTGAPASPADIEALEAKLGRKLFPEFHDFYSTMNGFGTRQDGEVEWFFHPLESIPNLTEDTRDWFRETHPEVAADFVTFIDWGGGDTCGYLYGEDADWGDAIVMFEHEAYEADAEQDPNDFILIIDAGIESFLEDIEL